MTAGTWVWSLNQMPKLVCTDILGIGNRTGLTASSTR